MMDLRRSLSRRFFGRQKEIPARSPVAIPIDGAKPCTEKLPDLVVQQILTHLHAERPGDMLTVALASKSLYRVARYVHHSHVHINLDKPGNVLRYLDLISGLDQAAAVHTLRVSGRRYERATKENEKILARLSAMVPAMTGLRRLEWHVGYWPGHGYKSGSTLVPIPEPILAALPAGCRLYTSIFCNESIESHQQARVLLLSLVGNQNLHSLSLRISFIKEYICQETMQLVKQVILSCPNLTRIPHVDVWYPRGGCEGYGPGYAPGPYHGLGLENGEKPPALEELGLPYYPWGKAGKQWCQGYTPSVDECQYWADTFDWSRLVRLNGIHFEPWASIGPKLINVREVALNPTGSLKIGDFLNEMSSPLELLSLDDWDEIGNKPETITRFGDTLRHLQIHRPDRVDGSNTARNLDHLSNSLPHLEHLAIDMERDPFAAEWPYAQLDTIATFPSLRTLELWFPLNRDPPAPKPRLTVSSAEHLFDNLHQRNSNIQRVTLHSGVPKVDNISLFGVEILAPDAQWDVHSCVSFVCELDPRQGVSVWCPELSTDMNLQLRRMVQQNEKPQWDPASLDADGLLLKAAFEGPVDRIGWDTWLHKEWAGQQETTMQKWTGSVKRALKR